MSKEMTASEVIRRNKLASKEAKAIDKRWEKIKKQTLDNLALKVFDILIKNGKIK